MDKEKFEEIKKDCRVIKNAEKDICIKLGRLIGKIECHEDLTRKEILDLMYTLFLKEE